MNRPAFLITIDTEGDNIWAGRERVATHNAAYLARFQSLCEAYGLKPTYLTNWEMAICPAFQELGRDVLKRGTAEIGMHLHAWNNPPLHAPIDDDNDHMPYMIEYPEAVIRAKVTAITELLEATFEVRPVSHRAGRWAFNSVYARVLVDHGYLVECSVTPHVSWRSHLGHPTGQGGADYRQFPESAYFLDLDNIDRPGDSTLLEVPMTITRRRWWAPIEWVRRCARDAPLARRALAKYFPPQCWLRPDGRNLARMVDIVRGAVAERRDYVEFMLHSSELMPGGSPVFTSVADVEKLYENLEALFADAARYCDGMTLHEYYGRVTAAGGRRDHQRGSAGET